ncbi:MAG: hypothetical protein IT341_02920 [Chloroflexi bacterium]|nr:hypothetical protein [Chloroflexota bacterium]
MAERPAPLVLVATPRDDLPFGSHAAVAATGQHLLANEMANRLGALGAATTPLPFSCAESPFHWGRWFSAAARTALSSSEGEVDAIGYVGAGALALLDDLDLDGLLTPIRGEVVANNRFSADAFVVAGDLSAALAALETCATDNGAPRCLADAGFAWRDLGSAAWARFDVDTTLDLALLRLATHLDGQRPLAGPVSAHLEMARLPGDRALDVPHLAAIGDVVRDRGAELVVTGRISGRTWAELEADAACRVRGMIEERGMRAAHGGPGPRSLLAAFMARTSPAELVAELAALGDAVVLDTRVLMAAMAETSDAGAWPPSEERFASDFGDAGRISTPWLCELTSAAASAPVPFLLGGHALVSDGLRLILRAAWQGR